MSNVLGVKDKVVAIRALEKEYCLYKLIALLIWK
jgi:hypothetical protein